MQGRDRRRVPACAPTCFAEAVAADVAAGVRPIAAVATVGTTSTTSVDPVAAIADVCERHGMWLHVDAAYGGSAAVVPEMRHVLDGCDRADSLVVNPHKWLFTPVDCSLLYTARPDDLRAAFSLVPAYLTTPEDGGVVNLMDYGLSLGRRFRALKLWMVIRAYGAEGLAALISGHIELARRLASRPSRPSRAGSCSRRSRSRRSASAATRPAWTTRTSCAA